ncbi:uncharacterized protein Dmoj_GI20074 [Drosophila mojavensis]|uniref:Uncharacterized protein n=1 Tax=Drosophila mojavensis TaxID=7230 RepID=B4KLM0_DROMO|nr:uncharacterized protein Dmoj_GI20074 [Drosophila mojavensis]
MLAAGLMLDVVWTLPVNLDDIQETPETDEQLLKLLGGQSMEDTEQEHLRERRQPIEDPDHLDCHSHSHSHAHPDELAHELHGHKHEARFRRAADSSGSSEEKSRAQKEKKDSSGSSEEIGPTTASPANRRRRAAADSSGSSEEAGKDKAKEQAQDKDDSSSEEKPKRKKRAAVDNSSEDLESQTATNGVEDDFDAIPDSEYAQGCGILDVSSNELNNDTIYKE